MNKLLSPEYVRNCEYSENNVTCGNEPISTKSLINISTNMNASLSPENMIKCKYSEINTCSEPNNNNNNNNNNNSKYGANNVDDNHNYNNANNEEDEIVSIMLGTAVNNILNSISFYNKPVKDVLDNYDVNYKSECLGLVIIRVKSSQNLNFVESNMFCHYYDKKLEFAQLSENIKNEHNIPFNSEYIKAESKVSQCKVNKFEFESEYIESEYIVKKSTLRVAVKFKKKTHLLIHCQFVYHLLVPCNSTCSISLLIHLQNNSSSFSNFP